MIRQLTTFDQAMLDCWHAKAINSPRTRPFLSTSTYVARPVAKDDDWASSYFMCNSTPDVLMAINFRREEKSMSVSLWSITEQPRVVGRLLRFAALRVAPAYGIRWLDFCVSEANTEWLARLRSIYKLRGYEWGTQQEAAWDYNAGRFVGLVQFRVNISQLFNKRETDIPF